MSQQQLFIEATYSFKEIVKSISVRCIQQNAKGDFFHRLDLTKSQNWITEQRHRGFGRCYTYHPEPHMRNMGIYYIKLEL